MTIQVKLICENMRINSLLVKSDRDLLSSYLKQKWFSGYFHQSEEIFLIVSFSFAPLREILVQVWCLGHLHQNHLRCIFKMHTLRLDPNPNENVVLGP